MTYELTNPNWKEVQVALDVPADHKLHREPHFFWAIGNLAATRMVGRELWGEGYCITHVPTGQRMSYGGKVFKEETTARKMVELLVEHTGIDESWDDWFGKGNALNQTNLFRVFGELQKTLKDNKDFLPVIILPSCPHKARK